MNKRGMGDTVGAVFIGFIILVIAIYTAPTVETAIIDTYYLLILFISSTK